MDAREAERADKLVPVSPITLDGHRRARLYREQNATPATGKVQPQFEALTRKAALDFGLSVHTGAGEGIPRSVPNPPIRAPPPW